MPPLSWRDPSTLMLLLAPTVDVGEELDVFSELLDWEFGLYSLDTSEATLARTQALRGFYPSAMLSPDMDRLGYVRALRESEDREIYMVDLASGAEVLYASGNEARLIHWGPDSHYFLFAVILEDQWQVSLGQVDQEPVPLDIRLDDITWLDEGRVLAKPAASDLELHLYTVGGGDTLIASAQPSP